MPTESYLFSCSGKTIQLTKIMLTRFTLSLSQYPLSSVYEQD